MLGHLSLRQQQQKSLSHWVGFAQDVRFHNTADSWCSINMRTPLLATATCLEHHKLHTAKFTGLISDCVKKLDWVQTTFPKWLNSIKQDARLTTRQTPGQTTTCSQETLGQRAIDTNGKKTTTRPKWSWHRNINIPATDEDWMCSGSQTKLSLSLSLPLKRHGARWPALDPPPPPEWKTCLVEAKRQSSPKETTMFFEPSGCGGSLLSSGIKNVACTGPSLEWKTCPMHSKLRMLKKKSGTTQTQTHPEVPNPRPARNGKTA